MPYLLIPNEAKTREVLMWVAVINERDLADPGTLILRCNGSDFAIPAGWIRYTTGSGLNSILYQFFTVPNLQPRTDYIFELFRSGNLVATSKARTLPEALPFQDSQPFTVLLGSCFASSRPESTNIGNMYLRLRNQDKPDIKILCGDQVYLDDPALHFTFNRHSRNELEDELFANYSRTWNQSGFETGNRQLLQDGANFFTADDHEFWNNAPNRATLVPDTYFEGRRTDWREIASHLLQIFQTSKTVTRFEVAPVSFFLADTRVNRGPGTNDFMSQADRNELAGWVNGLQGLGVLVIGQPAFAKKASWFSSRFADKNLPNYKQYEDLARILSGAKRSILLLTGDVHFGRIASCQLGDNVFLYEIISSPSALVNAAVGGKWESPPELFPAFGIDGVVNRPVSTNMNFRMTANHLLTLSFFRDGAHTRVRVKSLEILGNGQAPAPVEIADLIF